MKKIVIDLMGADDGMLPILQGAIRSLDAFPEIQIVVTGNETDIRKELPEDADLSRIEIIHAEDVITNDEPATCIFNGKDNSSMVRAIEALKKDNDCIGLLSAGNTGALLVGSTFRLGLTAGLKTPALSSSLQCINGKMVCLVDCGANVNCTAKDMANFALLGNAFARSMYQLEEPRVALLSVGREKGKGNPLALEAYSLMEELPINFIGNAEGYDLINGYADVVVADGFAGNIMLKCVEGAGKAAMQIVREQQKAASSEDAAMYDSILEKLNDVFELNTRGGATFLGTKKPVVKMHGCATEETVVACVGQLLNLNAGGFDRHIADIQGIG